MKKIASISLVFIFLVSTLGLRFVINYCPMMEGYSIALEKHNTCCCSDDSEENDCCESTEFSLHKIEDQYTSVSYNFTPPQFEFTDFVFTSSIVIPDNTFLNEVIFYKDLKPPKIPVSLNILYRTLLI